jgi:Ca2+-binding EF-hand superfamily protein
VCRTYVSEYFHRFAAQEAKEASARRAAKFVQFIRSTNALKAAYEHQAQELLTWVGSVIAGWENESFTDSLDNAQATVDRLKQFVLEDEPTHAAAKLDLEALYAEIQTKLKVNGRHAYDVPGEVSPDAIEEAFHQLYLARQQHARKARDHRFQFIKKEEVHLSDEKMSEFKESFSHFDTDKDGFLQKDEFKAATASVGVSLKDNELDSTFAQLSNGVAQGVSESSYLSYLVKLSEDVDTAEQIKASFKQLANDRQFVTLDDLSIPPLSKEDAELLNEILPKNAEGELDYNAFIDSNYSKDE